MSVPKQVKISGAMTIGPIQPTTAPFPSGEGVVSLNLLHTSQVDTGPRSRMINSPASFEDLLAGTGITNLRWLYLRPRNATLTFRLTSPAGVDQVLTISEMLVMSCPSPGSEWTSLGVQGAGDLEMMLAGD